MKPLALLLALTAACAPPRRAAIPEEPDPPVREVIRPAPGPPPAAEPARQARPRGARVTIAERVLPEDPDGRGAHVTP